MEISLKDRIEQLDWSALASDLNGCGYALTPPLLSSDECDYLISLYPEDRLFRSHIIMARYRFGSGDYKYFSYPLPPIVHELRTSFYAPLANIANDWNAKLEVTETFPPVLEQLLRLCHLRGQKRPTPLLLHYEAGDYNCLHQDLYGALAFPFQLTCFLSSRTAYTGGEFVLTEQQLRAQSKAEVLSPGKGQILVFTTRFRPVKGTRGYHRVTVRHGVSPIRSGVRYTLGVPFHDAE